MGGEEVRQHPLLRCRAPGGHHSRRRMASCLEDGGRKKGPAWQGAEHLTGAEGRRGKLPRCSCGGGRLALSRPCLHPRPWSFYPHPQCSPWVSGQGNAGPTGVALRPPVNANEESEV